MCDNTNKAVTAEDIAKAIGLPDTVDRKEYNTLMEEYRKLDIQLRVANEDLDSKIAINGALAGIILSTKNEDLINQMNTKLGEIFKRED